MIEDEVLTDAMANAAESKRVLFLTPSWKATPPIVKQALEASVSALVKSGKDRSFAEQFFRIRHCPWQITVGGNGWVFFFPLTDLDPSEDVGNPDLVYFPDEDGTYFSMDYRSWVTQKTRENSSMWSSVLES